MANYIITDTDATAVADAIRAKTETSDPLVYPNGFKNALDSISSDCNASAGHMLSGKTGMVNGSIITGTIASKAAATYNVSSSDRTIDSGQYLSGAQTIRGVTTSNITAGNIKRGVVVTVGDTGSATRIKNVTGTMIPLYWGAPTWCPFMWENDEIATPGQGTLSGASSGTAAQTANGYRFTTSASPGSGAQKSFRVPFKTKITYYQSEGSTSTKTATLNTGVTYTMQHNDNTYEGTIVQGSTSIAKIYKLISYERVL